MNPAVETTLLTKRYGRVAAVDGLSMTVRPGEVYGFLGPNGAGKTTTLRMLLGLIAATSGRVRLMGRDPGPGFLDHVGALIEGPSFYPYLSGRDNVRAMAHHAGVPRERVDDVLAVVGLSDRAGDRYSTFSLGMKQRLGLAAALLKRPDLLVLDEPTNGLDPAGIAELRLVLRGLAAGGCTVLLSSHLLGEVQQICDRVGVIVGGRLVAEQAVDDGAGRCVLRVVAHPVEAAHEHVASMVGPHRVRRVEDAVEADVDPAEFARVNAALVGAGIAVHELRRAEADLERTFLELTTGGDHA